MGLGACVHLLVCGWLGRGGTSLGCGVRLGFCFEVVLQLSDTVRHGLRAMPALAVTQDAGTFRSCSLYCFEMRCYSLGCEAHMHAQWRSESLRATPCSY